MAYKPVGVDELSHFPPRVEEHIQELIDASTDALVDGAPGALNTLNEIATQLASDESAVSALTTTVAGKADSSTVSAHIANTSNPHSVTKSQVGLGSVDNVSAAALRDRSTHTGTQAASTISDFTEAAQDAVFPAMVAGSNVTLTHDDTANTLTIASSGGGASVVENVNTVATSGSAVTLPDVTTATMHDVTLTANCTFTFPTVAAGKSFTLRLTQDATGGRTATWPATVKWSQAIAPTLSTGAGKSDILTFVSIGGTTWSGFLSGLDMR